MQFCAWCGAICMGDGVALVCPVYWPPLARGRILMPTSYGRAASPRSPIVTLLALTAISAHSRLGDARQQDREMPKAASDLVHMHR